MSERYGTISEVYEAMPDFEDWVREEIAGAQEALVINDPSPLSCQGERNAIYQAARIDTLRDVLSWWGVG